MNNVAISGGTGMIGVALIKTLLSTDIRNIYVLCRMDSQKLNRLPQDKRIQVIPCDLEQITELPTLIDAKCDIFYHFAWLGTGGAQRNLLIDSQAANIKYTLDAMDAAYALGCSKFIGAGSQAEYGLLDLDTIRPNSPCNPIQAYGIAKYAAGKLAMLKAEMLNMDCLWVRIFSVYGTLDRPNSMISSTITRLIEGESPLFTPALQRWDYLYENDAGEAFAAIGEHAIGRKVYCLGSGEARPLQEYLEELRRIVNPDVRLAIGALPYPSNAVMNLCADINELVGDTGWHPKTSFQRGIEEILKYRKSNL